MTLGFRNDTQAARTPPRSVASSLMRRRSTRSRNRSLGISSSTGGSVIAWIFWAMW